MTTQTIKTILFASLIAALILPLSTVDFAEADKKDLTDNEKRFQKFIKLTEKQDSITVKMEILIHDNGNPKLIEKLEKQIEKLEKQRDKLQQEEIDAVAINDKDLVALEDKAQRVLKEARDPNSKHFVSQGAVHFVNQVDRSINILVPDEKVRSNLGPELEKSTSPIKQGKHKMDEIDYNVEVIEKLAHHYIFCTNRDANCYKMLGGLGVQQDDEDSTMSFGSKQLDGDTGFVMTAHGANYEGAQIKQFPDRIVGTVDQIDHGFCDCAFVKLNTGAGIGYVQKVFKYSIVHGQITSYESGLPPVGTWLMKSGLASGATYGQFQGFIPSIQQMGISNMHSEGGDSGAPIVTAGGFNLRLYGMLTSSSLTWSYATPFHIINSTLSLQQ